MAKALLISVNAILSEKTVEEIKANILRQYNEGGVIVLDSCMRYEVVEFDTVQVNGSSPVALGKSEKFGEIDGHSIYVVRDEYGRIVVSDELFKELIERYNNDKTGNT